MNPRSCMGSRMSMDFLTQKGYGFGILHIQESA